MRDFVNGDRVEILAPKSDAGAVGKVTKVTEHGCIVKIINSGNNFAMTKKLGNEIAYLKRNIRMI